jgi:8-oxo-dGTP pyrophosphatase MutT (NUDIX family)
MRITSREEKGDYRVFRVDRLTLAIEDDGQPPRTRDAFVFRTPDWCNVLALTPNEEIVFVRQFRFGTGSDTLELPGGVLDPGESPRAAALRELREESGYEPPDPSSVEPLLEIFANPALQDTRVHTFLARGVVLAPGGTSFDESEHCELVLVPLRELVSRLDAGEITHSLCRLPLELFLRKESLGALRKPVPRAT